MSSKSSAERQDTEDDVRTFIEHDIEHEHEETGRWRGFDTISRMSEIIDRMPSLQSPKPERRVQSPTTSSKNDPRPETPEAERKTNVMKKRMIERRAVDDFEEFRQAMSIYAQHQCPVSIQMAFCEDVRIFFEIMGPDHDRAALKVIVEAFSLSESNKSQITALLRYVVSRMAATRLMTEAVWLSGRIASEFVNSKSDDFELLGVLEYLKKRYCADGGKASDRRYFKGKEKVLKSNYKKAKHSFKKNAIKNLKTD